MPPILQNSLPHIVWTDPRLSRLPGILPVEGDDWLRVDDAFGRQMAERDRLIQNCPDEVHALLDRARPAADELFDRVLEKLSVTEGYRVGQQAVLRPDGVEVALDRALPLLTLGRLVQEDLCLMQQEGDEHVLTGAVLCFPASWSLHEKLGRPLMGIHRRVPHYTGDVARRVQRLFEMIRPEQPLWRMNALVYVDPALHQPRHETDPRTDRTEGRYLRSERQCLLRLPQTNAVVFAIHTYVVLVEDLPEAARAAMATARL